MRAFPLPEVFSKASQQLLSLWLCTAAPASCSTVLQDNMVIDDFKYSVKVIRRAPFIFNVQLNKSNVDVVARKLGDGGFLLQVSQCRQYCLQEYCSGSCGSVIGRRGLACVCAVALCI
jgi:hypothetical protein